MPEAIDHDGPLVHKWRAAQLKRLGIPEPLVEVEDERRAMCRAAARHRNRARRTAIHE
jgi:hypothetical protein